MMATLDNDLGVKLAKLLEKFDHFDPMEYGRLTEKVDKMERTVEDLTKSVQALTTAATQAKGAANTAFWVIAKFGHWFVILPGAAAVAQEKWHLFV
jgi:hypothetical protein